MGVLENMTMQEATVPGTGTREDWGITGRGKEKDNVLALTEKF